MDGLNVAKYKNVIEFLVVAFCICLTLLAECAVVLLSLRLVPYSPFIAFLYPDSSISCSGIYRDDLQILTSLFVNTAV